MMLWIVAAAIGILVIVV